VILNKDKYDIVTPDAESFLQSARSYGYSIDTAIADIIDNCITASATEITITFGVDQFSSFVRIEDNGVGMNEAQLKNAMKIGSFNPLDKRLENDLGRFGLGLKTASFSQCRRLTVKTKNKKGSEYIRCWDLDVVADEKDWVLLRECADKNSEKNLARISNKISGTIILWEKLDRLDESLELKSKKEHFYRKFDNVKKHLGLTFHRFIEEGEIAIKINSDLVEALNPFNVSKEVPSTELPEEHLSINGQGIIIQPFILPHESKISIDERKDLEIIKGWTEHQGIYLYRNKRLISDGTWLDLNFRKKESQRLCRIRIDIPNTLDKEWHIDVKKASAKIPDVIRKRIKDICMVSIEKAIKVYSHRGAYLKRSGDKKEIVYLWKSKQKNGKRYYEINLEHPIYKLLEGYLEEDSLMLKDYLKLIAESLPIDYIVNDFSDPNISMKEFFEGSKNELQEIYKNTISTLVSSGISEKDATEKVNRLECFQQIIK